MKTAILKKLATKYLVTAMLSWVHLSDQLVRDSRGHWLRDDQGMYLKEDEEAARERYEKTAEDIVDVAFDDTLKPLFRGDLGRFKTALLEGAVGSLEGGFHAWVENGDCNKADWLGGGCDGGHAFSDFQIHVYRYVIKDDAITPAQYVDRAYLLENPDAIITGQTLIDDHRKAALVAYYLLRDTLTKHSNLCGYTGERCDGPHPKADQRLGRAMDYWRDHPFVMPTDDELEFLEAEEDLD